MHTPEWSDEILSKFDADEIVGTLAEAGCRAMVVFAKDTYGNAYYNTRYGHKNRCMGERDFLREFLEAGERYDVRMAAYFCAIWDNLACEEHPDWQLCGPDGQPCCDVVTNDGIPRWHSVCHNSGIADLMEHMVEEVAQNYPVDGFHLDMFNMDFGSLSCYCDNCRRLFREATGKDLPTVPTWDETWREFLEFRYASVERYMQRLRAAAHRYAPDAAVLLNYHGGPGFDWRTGQMPVRHALLSDLGTIETYTPMLGTLYPGMGTRYVRSIAPERHTEVVSWRMNRVTDFTTKPLAQVRWELFGSMCFGAGGMLIDQTLQSGLIDPYPYKRFAQVFAEANEKQPYFGGTTQRHVAIYYSCKSRDYYGRCTQEKFQQPVIGAYKACIENHFDVDFLFDEQVSREKLAQYPVVILPNTAILDDTECALFADYVREGGTLLASFDTSLYDRMGEPLNDFRLAEVFGLHYAGIFDCDTCFVRNIPGSLGAGVDSDCYVLVEGQARNVRPDGAAGLGDLHDSFHKCRVPEQFYSHSVHPPYTRAMDAVYVNKYGKGKALYYPWNIHAAYASLHELPEHRILLRNAVREAGFTPNIEVEAPLNVDAAVLQQNGRWVVHLMGFNGMHQACTLPDLNRPIRPSIRMEEPPVYYASLHMHIPFTGARAYNEATELTREGNTVRLLCKDVHEIIIIETA